MSLFPWLFIAVVAYFIFGTMYITISLMWDIHWKWLGRWLIDAIWTVGFFLGAIIFWPAVLYSDVTRYKTRGGQ